MHQSGGKSWDWHRENFLAPTGCCCSCSHSSSMARIWVPFCENLGQEIVDIFSPFPGDPKGFQSAAPCRGDPGLEGGCRQAPFLHRHLGDCPSRCCRHRAGTQDPQGCGCSAVPALPAAQHRLTSCIPASAPANNIPASSRWLRLGPLLLLLVIPWPVQTSPGNLVAKCYLPARRPCLQSQQQPSAPVPELQHRHCSRRGAKG